MGFKAIKQHYDIGYIVAIYNEEKYGGDCICIGSGFVHGLIAINIETGKVFYSSLVTPGENSEIGQLAARIKADEKNGVLRALMMNRSPSPVTSGIYYRELGSKGRTMRGIRLAQYHPHGANNVRKYILPYASRSVRPTYLKIQRTA